MKSDGSMTIRPTAENNKQLDKQNNKNEFLNNLMSDYFNGKLIDIAELDTKDMEELKKEKIAMEIELHRLKQEKMKAQQVIDKASELKVRKLHADIINKELKNEMLQRQLTGIKIPAGTSVSSNRNAFYVPQGVPAPKVPEFTIKCTFDGCGKEWDSGFYEDREAPLWDMRTDITRHKRAEHMLDFLELREDPIIVAKTMLEGTEGKPE